MSQDLHPSVESLLRERLGSSYNVLKEPAHPALLATVDQLAELLGRPFDGDNIEGAKLVSVTLLGILVQLHYELQSELRSKEASGVAELINHSLKLSQEVHKLADAID